MNNTSRRKFIKNSTAVVTMAGLTAIFPKLYAGVGDDRKIRVAAIGINGMGWSDLNALLKHSDVVCTALCDVDNHVLQKRIKELRERGITATGYTDYRDVLKSKDVDVVVIGTPDHWHCLQMIEACQAGKDVYVEKPLGNSIAECRAMMVAVEKNKSIVQVGQWQRSQQHFKDAVAFVHSGKLGKIRLVKAWAYQGWMKSIPVKPDGPVPAGVHYDLWLGPAKKQPFNPNRFHFDFRWYWDYAGGLMTDWGVHMLDYALLGMKASTPISIMASGGKFAYPQDAAQTPDTLTTVYEFEGFNIQWEHATGIDGGPYGKDHGVAFIGNNGTLVLNRSGWEVIPEKGRMEGVAFQRAVDDGLDLHAVNFIEAVKSRDSSTLNCPVKAGAEIAIFSQMGNIAYRTGKKIYWNPDTWSFGMAEADQLISAAYHNGYRLPKV
ncbi:Gfo/Idh/MocA family oxidoreductase [Sphingobacterium sp. PCS056]|uniref:Gfo/Idh/MocA family protein n=1 Tax=Sphingobacterium sp. PCS056 TaxID=2931400 RepID=UPI0020109FF4|nr:Gfo/Idh/MocA family oxidoreductase [Sphingobacterium sp. PCS056]UPZ35119.1 Gfo/Idh/MocA family oxidoreductase [Sphingobacterium sp. PCS056]